jgi:hypothetical protein
MIDEDDMPQAIFDYAVATYAKRSRELTEKYVEEFPERNLDLPDEAWQKNFLCWLFYEKVLPETGKTIAEEFAEQSTELTPDMKKNVMQMRNMVRSDFVVISEKGDMMKIKDMKNKTVYNVKRVKDNQRYPPNTLIIGRIHPFGDHYRTTGFLLIRTTPLILDPDILMHAFENNQVERFEDIQLRKSSTFQSVMNKYPSHWIDSMCNHYHIKQKVKKDKIRAIENTLMSDLPRIIQDLPEKCKDVLQLCLKNDGFIKYGMLKDYDDDLGFFWEKQTPASTIGELRQKGLLFVGKMGFGDRNYKIAFIPVEIRDDLKDLLVSEQKTSQTKKDVNEGKNSIYKRALYR